MLKKQRKRQRNKMDLIKKIVNIKSELAFIDNKILQLLRRKKTLKKELYKYVKKI